MDVKEEVGDSTGEPCGLSQSPLLHPEEEGWASLFFLIYGSLVYFLVLVSPGNFLKLKSQHENIT